MNNEQIVPYKAVHPCKGLKDEILARGMSIKEFAGRMGMKQSNISRLFRGDINITLEMAKRLESALGISAKTWADLQLQYDEDVKAIELRDSAESKAIELENILAQILNLQELFKRLNISTTLFVQEKLSKIQDTLGINLTNIDQLNFGFIGDFKKSDRYSSDIKNIRTWVLLAGYEAGLDKVNCGIYEKGNAEKAAIEIASLVHNEAIVESSIKRLLNKYGIQYAVVEKLEKTPIDAFSRQISDNPCIVTTHRYNDSARLVFNILHELGHIHLHIDKGNELAFIAADAYSNTDTREVEANKFAQEHLISKDIWRKLWTYKSEISESRIVSTLRKFSKANNLNFDIVCWRYKHETNRYNLYGTKPSPIQ